MSLGNQGYAKLIAEDENTVIYEYKAIFLTDPLAFSFDVVQPGYFYIQKTCFQEPEIHSRIRRRPKTRKKYLDIKKIHVSVDCSQYIDDGRIVIEYGTTYSRGSIYSDLYVISGLLHMIFDRYQDNSEIPKAVYLCN